MKSRYVTRPTIVLMSVIIASSLFYTLRFYNKKKKRVLINNDVKDDKNMKDEQTATNEKPIIQDKLNLPIVDISLYFRRNTDPHAYRIECSKVAEALHKYGVAIIHDPRVIQSDNEKFLDMLEKYFELSDGVRDARPDYSYQVGVTPSHIELPRNHCGIMGAYTDENKPISPCPPELDAKWRFFWRIGPQPPYTNFPILNMEPVIPPEFPQWKECMDIWGYKMLDALTIFAEMAAEGFGLSHDAFTRRMLYGPHLLAPTGSDLKKFHELNTVLAGYHYDLNFLTIHGKSRFPGLYIWTRDGCRKSVEIPPDCLLVQAGKQIEYLTGGHVLAGFHEVVVSQHTLDTIENKKLKNESLWRVSSTCFGHIQSDQILYPLGHFLTPETKIAFPPIMAGNQVKNELLAIALDKGLSTHRTITDNDQDYTHMNDHNDNYHDDDEDTYTDTIPTMSTLTISSVEEVPSTPMTTTATAATSISIGVPTITINTTNMTSTTSNNTNSTSAPTVIMNHTKTISAANDSINNNSNNSNINGTNTNNNNNSNHDNNSISLPISASAALSSKNESNYLRENNVLPYIRKTNKNPFTLSAMNLDIENNNNNNMHSLNTPNSPASIPNSTSSTPRTGRSAIRVISSSSSSLSNTNTTTNGLMSSTTTTTTSVSNPASLTTSPLTMMYVAHKSNSSSSNKFFSTNSISTVTPLNTTSTNNTPMSSAPNNMNVSSSRYMSSNMMKESQ